MNVYLFFFVLFFVFVFAFNSEIPNGYQKWRENDFWEKWPLDSADTLWVKNFVKIDLCCTVSEITVFLRKLASTLCRYPVGQISS